MNDDKQNQQRDSKPNGSEGAFASTLLCEVQDHHIELSMGLSNGEIAAMQLLPLEGARLAESLIVALDKLPGWTGQKALAAWRENPSLAAQAKAQREATPAQRKQAKLRKQRRPRPFSKATGHYLKISGFLGDTSLRRLPILAGFGIDTFDRHHHGGVLIVCRHELVDDAGKKHTQDVLIRLSADQKSREAQVLGGTLDGHELVMEEWHVLSDLKFGQVLEREGTKLLRLKYHEFSDRVSRQRYQAVKPDPWA